MRRPIRVKSFECSSPDFFVFLFSSATSFDNLHPHLLGERFRPVPVGCATCVPISAISPAGRVRKSHRSPPGCLKGALWMYSAETEWLRCQRSLLSAGACRRGSCASSGRLLDQHGPAREGVIPCHVVNDIYLTRVITRFQRLQRQIKLEHHGLALRHIHFGGDERL